jgi:hypothetical protein
MEGLPKESDPSVLHIEYCAQLAQYAPEILDPTSVPTVALPPDLQSR